FPAPLPSGGTRRTHHSGENTPRECGVVFSTVVLDKRGKAERDPGPITTGHRFAKARATVRRNHSCLWLWVPAFAGTTAERLFDSRIRNERRALHLALRVARIALRLLLAILLVGAVAAVEAAGGGAEHAVMAGVMAGDAADHGALEAAL